MKEATRFEIDQDTAAHIERLNRRHEAFMREMAGWRAEAFERRWRTLFWVASISIFVLAALAILAWALWLALGR